MCKYCEYTYIGEHEKSNDNKDIDFIEEGHHVLHLSINRYDDGVHSNNELILDSTVVINGHVYTIVDKHININYCPFCGEKL